MMKDLQGKLYKRLMGRWIVCGVVPDKKSVQYGIYFSYPLYILLVTAGILLNNPYILLVAALIAFFGIKLPMHPFDYIYNYGVARLLGTNKIPGRGSELQVNSIVSVLFCLIVAGLIVLEVSINYEVLAFTYVLVSIFFISIFLFKNRSPKIQAID